MENDSNEEDMTYEPVTFDQRVTAQLARTDTELRKLRDEVEHLKAWVHKLLNPNEEPQP